MKVLLFGNSDLEELTIFARQHWSHWPGLKPCAKELDGTIRIGAVNCEEDWILCRQENVRSYPSLIFYPDVSLVQI
jgi:hypothetical protein